MNPWPLDPFSSTLEPYSSMNILIIQLLRLGDAVQILPIVHGLKERFPRARIHVLASTLGKTIFDMEPLVAKTFVLRKELISAQARCSRPVELASALEMLRADLAPLLDIQWDWVVNFSFSFPSALAAFLLNPGRISGYAINPQRQFFSKEKWFAHSLASFCRRPYSNFNWVDINKRIIDLPAVPGLPLLTVNPELTVQARRHLEAIGFGGHPLIGIHPGASNDIKTWPLPNFAEFGRLMIDRHDYRVLILGGKDEIPSGMKLREMLGVKAHNLTGQTTLEQLKAYLKACTWLVGNDTGPIHLAAAVGTRTLALFFNSHFVETGVYAAGHIALHPDLPCFPCRGPARCAVKECLKHIKPATLEKLILSQDN
ncbi:MAG: glycosyltransferase family 9 protein, partial [Desulfobacteraceae bacterium]